MTGRHAKYTVDRRRFLGQNGRALELNVIRAAPLACAIPLLSFSVLAVAQGPAAPKPLVPAAANSIAADPDAYYGRTVTVTAAVERVVSPVAFTVDQDVARSGPSVLVLVETLTAPVAINSYVTVIGEVVRHEGAPAIRAVSVLTAAMVDLAKRQPPPLSPEEEAFDKLMKRVGAAFTAVRQAVSAGGAPTAGDEAMALVAAFAETDTFWQKRAKADAQQWAAEARRHAQALADAVKTGKWEAAQAAVSPLQQTCSSCHGAYRERQEDGSYRIRTESR